MTLAAAQRMPALLAMCRRFRRAGLRTLFWISLLVAGSAGADTLAPLNVDNPLAEPRFESVGVGIIPRDVVPTMAQDRAGFMWIATGDGLVRFDGYRFRPQERDSPDPAARNLGWIRALLPGRDGRLWIGTEWDGLAVYDPASEKVTAWRGKGDHDGGPRPTIRALAEDADGSIWAGIEGGGLEHHDLKSGRVARYRHAQQAGSLPDDRVQSLLVDRQGTLWVGTWAGLSRRQAGSAGSDDFEPVSSSNGDGRASLAGRVVEALVQASDGRIWVGTRQGDLAIVDPATGRGVFLDYARDNANNGAVSSLVEAPGGQMWVGRSTGIDLHDAADGRLIQRLRHDLRKRSGLAGNEVTALIRDQAGLIWVGGFGLGLQRHDPGNRSIWLRGADEQPDSPFSKADVRALLQVDNGEIWAATPKGDVAVMDPLLRVTGAVSPQASGATAAGGQAGQPPPIRIEAMTQAGDGSVWLGADSMLYQFSRDHRQLRALPHGGGLTRRLLASSDGSLWVATQDGVHRLRPGATEVVRINLPGGQALHADINALAEASDGSVWVGGGKGLFRAAAGSSELQPVESPAGAGLNPSVIGLLFDSQQTLWVDTAVTGLHRMLSWDGRQARFEHISERHGIVSRPFGGNLLEDGRGRIWTQMHVYDPASDRLDELTAADGANLGTGWFLSRTKTTDGRMLFGGSKGILVVRPERYDASTYQPPLLVAELTINGQRESAGGILGGLVLAPEQRSFSLAFTAVDFSDPGRVRYAYQLQGFDPDWIDTRAESRVASYSNLDPGDYLLRVRATNRSGVWSPHELAIPVRILPAWWQSWWFRLFILSLSTVTLYGLLQLRTRHLRLRQRELKHLVRERTAELETLALALQRESAALEESSLTDPLTGLRNRRFLTQHIEADAALALREFQSHCQYGAPLRDDAGLIFFLFDIDSFKPVNDQHGHAAGDAVIRQMADRLARVFRDTDYLVRWGGEEFLVVARATPRDHAAELAERARAAVAEQPFAIDDGRLLSKTCSIGFCCFPLSTPHADALDWGDVVKIADAALYLVKTAGRNGWLGVLGARSESAAGLRASARRPLTEWTRSGDLDIVWSPDHEGLAAIRLLTSPQVRVPTGAA
ncbi:ligand-binding sensor domain-containing diguanylate cyclase [Accumulibacter sp.]|uniref:ligand-binding sensor domain-containing diguanylate cyclase n=1 Tax=Accumulibacter sp. TaxID=2053492 RepID=UPI0026212DF8|nr:ligand-binding sensor domain-containing diguanylate cyclase [Accumulibacter sp.]